MILWAVQLISSDAAILLGIGSAALLLVADLATSPRPNVTRAISRERR